MHVYLFFSPVCLLVLSLNYGPVKCAKECDKSVVILVNTAYMQTVIYKLESFIFSSKVGPLDFHTYWKGYRNGLNSILKGNSLLSILLLSREYKQFLKCLRTLSLKFQKGRTKTEVGGFHLYLLVFPFIYQFYSRIEALVSSSFAND